MDNNRQRKGQELINFLMWLHEVKGYPSNASISIADPFYFDDTRWDGLLKEYKSQEVTADGG